MDATNLADGLLHGAMLSLDHGIHIVRDAIDPEVEDHRRTTIDGDITDPFLATEPISKLLKSLLNCGMVEVSHEANVA